MNPKILATLILLQIPNLALAQQQPGVCDDMDPVEVSGSCRCPARTTTGNINSRYDCNDAKCAGCARTAVNNYRDDRKGKKDACKTFCENQRDSGGKPCLHNWTPGVNQPTAPACPNPPGDTWEIKHTFYCTCDENPEPEPTAPRQ